MFLENNVVMKTWRVIHVSSAESTTHHYIR